MRSKSQQTTTSVNMRPSAALGNRNWASTWRTPLCSIIAHIISRSSRRIRRMWIRTAARYLLTRTCPPLIICRGGIRLENIRSIATIWIWTRRCLMDTIRIRIQAAAPPPTRRIVRIAISCFFAFPHHQPLPHLIIRPQRVPPIKLLWLVSSRLK